MSNKLDEKDLELKQKIADRIKELRESTETKQAHFAIKMAKDKQALNRMESGRGMTIYSINKFCRTAGIKLKDFFDSPLFD